MKMKNKLVSIVMILTLSITNASVHDMNQCRLKKNLSKYGGVGASTLVIVGGAVGQMLGIPTAPLVTAGVSGAELSYSTAQAWLAGKRFYQGAENFYHANKKNLGPYDVTGKHSLLYMNMAKNWNKDPLVLAEFLNQHDLRVCNLKFIKTKVDSSVSNI